MHLLDDLQERNLIHQQTDAEGLRQHLATSRSVYAGFDPSRDSLGVGNLVPLTLLARFQRAGHRPVALLGGGTGLIGDPGGKSSERPLLSYEEIERHVEAIRPTFERVLDFSGQYAALLVNNADWLRKVGFLEALRDIGKHFSVNAMLQRDSVRERLNNREQGISYTEFSYMLLQAYDFQYLYDQHGVTVQAAGSDQWGNIVGGVDLIRRTRSAETFGLTAPLLLKADGTKFGKTESGNVWLSPHRTSPYAFYQFWLNAADADVPRFLKIFTLFEPARTAELLAAHAENPGARTAHRALAAHVTELVHGSTELAHAEHATKALFSGEVTTLPRPLLEEVFATAPSAEVSKSVFEGEGKLLVDLLVEAGVADSKRQAREWLSGNAISINGQLRAVSDKLTSADLLHGDLVLIRRGRKNWSVLRAR
jgi:tyrosyl-tRNA synthetase